MRGTDGVYLGPGKSPEEVAFELTLGCGVQGSWQRDACCEILLSNLLRDLDWPFCLFGPQCPLVKRDPQ